MGVWTREWQSQRLSCYVQSKGVMREISPRIRAQRDISLRIQAQSVPVAVTLLWIAVRIVVEEVDSSVVGIAAEEEQAETIDCSSRSADTFKH